MYMLRTAIAMALLMLTASSGSVILSQGTIQEGRIRYTPGFKFKEGIYVGFDQVKNNTPIPKSSIITTAAYDDPEFVDMLMKEKKLQFFDNLGAKQEIPTKNIWGHSRNGILYIRINNEFFRITLIGSICHFVASQTTYANDYYNPYYYGNPYYSPYYSPYYTSQRNRTVEMKQFLLDFKTGNVLEYNEESVEVLLMADPELHDEYTSQGKKKKKQTKFLYIRKFNERNPLFFPQN